jgi:hypothetical protein
MEKFSLYEQILTFNPHKDVITSEAFFQFFHELIQYADEYQQKEVSSFADVEALIGSTDAARLMLAGMFEYVFSTEFAIEGINDHYNLVDDYLAATQDLDDETKHLLTALRQSYLCLYSVSDLTSTTVTLQNAIVTKEPPIVVTLEAGHDSYLENVSYLAARVLHLPEHAELSACWMPFKPNLAPESIGLCQQFYQSVQNDSPNESPLTEGRVKSLFACLIMGHWMVHAAISHLLNHEDEIDLARRKKKNQNKLSVIIGKVFD